MLSVSRMSETRRQEDQGRRVVNRQEVQQSGEIQQQTIRRARRIVTKSGNMDAENAFGSDSLFRRNYSDEKFGLQSEMDVKVILESV